MVRQRIQGVVAARGDLGVDRSYPPWLERGHSLPFGMLSDDEFEVFCYLLILREHPSDEIYYYGKTGDGGRDIVHHHANGTVDLIQCKRYATNVGIGEVRAELAKLCVNLHAGLIPTSFHRVVFYVATDLSAPAQDLLTSSKRWQKVAVKSLREHLRAAPPSDLCEFVKTWRPVFARETGLRLTTRATKHADLVDEFFAVRKVVDVGALTPLVEQGRQTQTKLDAILARHEAPRECVAEFEGPGGGPALPVARFVGRDAELAELRRALGAEGAAGCVVVTGLGGVGKTALVHHFVATEGRELFPDGVWWLDARAPAVEFQRVLTRLGLVGANPTTEDEARALLARTLHHRGALLVLDDVDPIEVDPRRLLVPGGRCRTVCTSRIATLAEQLGAPAASMVIGSWDLATARGYLRTAAVHTTSPDDELDVLAEHVGRLPLALQLLTWWLRRPGVTPGALRARLRRDSLGTLDRFAKEVGRGVAETFVVSFESLPPLEREVLLALASCARGTRAETVAAVAAVSPEEAVGALGELWERSLAEHTSNAERAWSVHDFVRLFLQAQEGAAAREAAHHAYCMEHLAALRTAGATDGFDEVVPEVLAASDRAIGRMRWREGWELLAGVDERLRRRGRHRDMVARYERMLPLVPSETIDAAIISGNLGLCYRSLGMLERATELVTHAVALTERLGDRQEQAKQLSNLGLCESVRGNTRRAVEHLQRSLNLSVELEELPSAVSALTNLAVCLTTLGELPQAATMLCKALEIADRYGWVEEQANILANLGVCARRQGQVQDAISLFERALALEQRLGRLGGVAAALGSLGNCYGDLDDDERSLDHHQRALAVEEQLGREEGIALAHGNLGTCFARRGDFHLALGHFRRALASDERLGLPEGQAIAHGNLGHTYMLMSEYAQATAHLKRALEIDEALERREGVADHLRDLAACADAQGEPLRAIALLERALAIEEKLGNPRRQIPCIILLGSALSALGRAQQAAECLAAALALARRAGMSDDDPRVRMLRAALPMALTDARAMATPPQAPPDEHSGEAGVGGPGMVMPVRGTSPRPRRS